MSHQTLPPAIITAWPAADWDSMNQTPQWPPPQPPLCMPSSPAIAARVYLNLAKDALLAGSPSGALQVRPHRGSGNDPTSGPGFIDRPACNCRTCCERVSCSATALVWRPCWNGEKIRTASHVGFGFCARSAPGLLHAGWWLSSLQQVDSKG